MNDQQPRRGRRRKSEIPATETATTETPTPDAPGTERPGAQAKPNARAKAEARAYEPAYGRPSRRRSSEARANAFNTLAWMMEGATGLVEELRHSDLGLSEEFWVHLFAMRREGLLAARAAIDSLLEKSEPTPPATPEQTQRQTRRGTVSIE